MSEKISLVEKGELLWNKAKIAETFNDFLKNAVNKPGINRDDDKFSDGPVLSTNPFDTAIQKFDNHPSVKLIRDITLSDMFPFESVSLDPLMTSWKRL